MPRVSITNQKNTIYLPPLTEHITSEGIENYYWPIGFNEISDFGKKLEYTMAEYLREYSNQEKILSYKVLIKHYVTEACGVFQGDLLRERIKDKNIDVNVSSDWLFYPYTLDKKTPPYPKILNNLKKIKAVPSILQRMKQPKRLFKVLSKVRPFETGGIKVDGLLLSKPTAENFKNDIIATQRTELISMHAKKQENLVFLCRSDRWFSEITDEEISLERLNIDSQISFDILSIIFNLYKDFGIVIESYAQKYLEDVLKEFFAIVSIHRSRLKSHQDIPQTIWTGTSGNIWDMMLRLETLNRGGVVTAHDHSGDRAHAQNFEMGWIEMYGANYFATFSKTQADSLKKYINSWPILDKKPPEIIFVGLEDNINNISKNKLEEESENKNVKKILLFSTVYDRDRGRGNPIFPMVPYIDWQARLIGRLNEWGYKVYFKPHPESPLLPPDSFSKDLNVTIVNGRFEDMSEDLDLYLFDFTQTSVFKPAILSKKPIVIIDFKGLDWVEGSRALLEKRTCIIEGSFDNENRVQVIWEEVKSALKTSLEKTTNMDFVNQYYK